MSGKFPWFSVFTTGNKLEQGLIFIDFPYVDFSKVRYASLISETDEQIPLEVKKSDMIIMTQSCDLASDKVKHVTLCPLYTLEEYLDSTGESNSKRKDTAKKLRSRQYVNLFLLNKGGIKVFGDKYTGFLVVKFDEAITLPKTLVDDAFASRKRHLALNPPYRESLAQAFGVFYMRVGNPEDYQTIDTNDYTASQTDNDT